MKSYHNTNGLSGNQLIQSEKKAKTQEDVVYEIFKKHKLMSASMTHAIYVDICKNNTPLTSIRRAITNLCDLGKLEKTEEMTMGIFGKPEHVYRLVENENTEIVNL